MRIIYNHNQTKYQNKLNNKNITNNNKYISKTIIAKTEPIEQNYGFKFLQLVTCIDKFTKKNLINRTCHKSYVQALKIKIITFHFFFHKTLQVETIK